MIILISGGKLDDEDPEETENHSQLLRPSYTPKSNDYGIDRVRIINLLLKSSN